MRGQRPHGPFLIYDERVMGLILCRSCADNYRHSESVSVMSLPFLESVFLKIYSMSPNLERIFFFKKSVSFLKIFQCLICIFYIPICPDHLNTSWEKEFLSGSCIGSPDRDVVF